MILTKNEMQTMEQASKKPPLQLMEEVGNALYNAILLDTKETDSILILAGNGNNGGDAFVLSRLLQNHRNLKIYLTQGLPKTKEAFQNYQLLPQSLFIQPKDFPKALKQATIVIDGIFGFSYHNPLPPQIATICKQVNQANKKVYSIDINTGFECDSLSYDKNALYSTITYAIEAYKPCHMFNKHHNHIQTLKRLSLNLPHPTTTIHQEMNLETFFKNFQKKPINAYKGTYGKTLLISGCNGMAGALSLNITGAKAMGASYIQVALEEQIYPILAIKHTTPVYSPFTSKTWYNTMHTIVPNASSIAFGSGATYMTNKQDILDFLIQNATVPLILDAEGLRLLKHNTYILRYAKAPLILTPHIHEFAELSNQSIEQIQDNPIQAMKTFVDDYKVNLVLKGPNTLCMFTNGEIYINQSGNQALATAGSGDVLTGILAALLTITKDVNLATMMAIFIHGYLAEVNSQTHSMQTFDLESIPQLMDTLFHQHNY